MSRRRGRVETAEYRGFMQRALKAYAGRVGEGDIAALPGLVAHLKETEDAIDEAVRQLRHWPNCYSWQVIADVLGVTRQAAQKRWRHLGTDRRPGGQPARLR